MQRQSVNSGTIRIGGNCSRESRRTLGVGAKGRHRDGSVRRAPAPLAQHHHPKEAEAPPSKPCHSVTEAALLARGLWVFSPFLPLSLLQCVHASWSSVHVCVLMRFLEVQTAPRDRSELSVPGSWSQYLGSNQSVLGEINPEYSLEGPLWKLKLQYFGHLM